MPSSLKQLVAAVLAVAAAMVHETPKYRDQFPDPDDWAWATYQEMLRRLEQ